MSEISTILFGVLVVIISGFVSRIVALKVVRDEMNKRGLR